jgi:hypothetical protein
MGLALIGLIAVLGCADSEYSSSRDNKVEDLINEFYISNQKQLIIKSITGGLPIDAYCVLVPYQDDLNSKDNSTVPANDFLKSIGLKPQEDYWHIVIKSLDKLILIRMNQRSTPLLTPASYLPSNCTVDNNIVISKALMDSYAVNALKIGY